ncbi:MAG: acyl-CoA dehydrogenase family protein [Pseudomonadota bacterium]
MPRAKIFASVAAVKVTNGALQLHGDARYSRTNPSEPVVRDTRMFTIGGGTAQRLRNQVTTSILGLKTSQSRMNQSKARPT